MKTIYLHIGKHKTGSTPIQRYISENSSFLESNGHFVVLNTLGKIGCHGIKVENLTNCTNFAHQQFPAKF